MESISHVIWNMDITTLYHFYSKYTLSRWRIYADEDYLFHKSIDIIPITSPSYDDSILRTISKVRNKYVYYYVMFF